MDLLPQLYAPNALFIDPVHRIQGLDAIDGYFRAMSTDLKHCEFHFDSLLADEQQVCVKWRMVFAHARLRGGQSITVPGMSWLLIADDRIVRHEDSYDMGAMLYEQLPVFGRLVKWLRSRLADTGSAAVNP